MKATLNMIHDSLVIAPYSIINWTANPHLLNINMVMRGMITKRGKEIEFMIRVLPSTIIALIT